MTNAPGHSQPTTSESGSTGLSNLLLLLLVVFAGYPWFERVSGKQMPAASPKWQHKAVLFERDDFSDFERGLDRLASEGWEYVGPLCNNGINGQILAFRRRI